MIADDTAAGQIHQIVFDLAPDQGIAYVFKRLAPAIYAEIDSEAIGLAPQFKYLIRGFD